MIWNIFQWRSLKTRVTLFTLVIFLFGIWSLSFYVSRMLREDMQRLLSEQQFSTASFVAAQVDSEMRQRLVALEEYATGRLDPSTLGDSLALQKRLENSPAIRSMFNAGLFVTALDGTAIASVPPTYIRVGLNYSDRDYIITPTKEGKSAIGKPRVGVAVKAPIIAMSTPICDANGKVIGVLVGVTDLTTPNFLDKVTHGGYGKTGGYMLVTPQHRLIVTASLKDRVMETLSPPGSIPTMDRFIQGYEGSAVYVNRFGIESLTSTKRIPIADWFVAVDLPTGEAFAPIRDMQQRMLLATLFLTLLAGGLIWWILRRQLSPLLATASAMAALSDTNQIPPPLAVLTQDEVGQLSIGFNRLIETWTQRESALRESEARFRSLTEMSSDFYWESDAEHRLTTRTESRREVSESVSVQGAAIGKRRWEVASFSPDEAGWQQHRATLDAHLPFRDFEISRPRANGTVHHVSVSGDPVFDASGTFIGYRGVGADITERKRAEQGLRERETQLQSILASTADGILAIDPNGKVIRANRRFAEMWRIPQSLLDSKDDKALLDHVFGQLADPNAFVRKVEELYGSDAELTDTIHFEDGRVFERFTAPLASSGSKMGRVWSFRDLTEHERAEAVRKDLEAQLRESQKMEALGTMAGGVAHDFNNALAMIIGNAELARQDVGPDHPALVSLEEIAKASRRAKDLVQQILAFSRRQKLELKATSLALAIVETARLIRATLPAMVSLNVNCEPNAPAVLADATQIKQILLNLCGNAIQAIQDQGSPGTVEINLRAHVQSNAVAPSNLKEGRYACLTVRDTGPGMDEATRSHIFEPFFTTKPVGKGTGLGLAVVHGIVQAHEAAIAVESAPGKGSALSIYFPAIDAQIEQIAQPDAVATQIDGAGKHVLYIDDEEAIIFLMQRLLERQGFRVSGYTDPREALAAVRANPGEFDLAVTDFNMPGMSGLEVASALREIRPDLPVVLASGYITEDLRQKAPAAGVRELIYKPNTVDDLCEAVARCANAQSAGGASKPS